MAIITHNSGEKWERFRGSAQLNVNTISRLVDDGVWTWRDLNKHGLRNAVPFSVPNGKTIVGSEYFSADGKQQLFDVDDNPVHVPQSLTPLQARRALRVKGVKETVDAYIATLNDEERDDWEYALEIRIDNPVLVAGAQILGLDLEELFILGETL